MVIRYGVAKLTWHYCCIVIGYGITKLISHYCMADFNGEFNCQEGGNYEHFARLILVTPSMGDCTRWDICMVY